MSKYTRIEQMMASGELTGLEDGGQVGPPHPRSTGPQPEDETDAVERLREALTMLVGAASASLYLVSADGHQQLADHVMAIAQRVVDDGLTYHQACIAARCLTYDDRLT